MKTTPIMKNENNVLYMKIAPIMKNGNNVLCGTIVISPNLHHGRTSCPLIM